MKKKNIYIYIYNRRCERIKTIIKRSLQVHYWVVEDLERNWGLHYFQLHAWLLIGLWLNNMEKIKIWFRCDILLKIKKKKLTAILFNIFLLEVNFDKSTIELHFFLYPPYLEKFQDNQRSIVMLSIKCLNFEFL